MAPFRPVSPRAGVDEILRRHRNAKSNQENRNPSTNEVQGVMTWARPRSWARSRSCSYTKPRRYLIPASQPRKTKRTHTRAHEKPLVVVLNAHSRAHSQTHTQPEVLGKSPEQLLMRLVGKKLLPPEATTAAQARSSLGRFGARLRARVQPTF